METKAIQKVINITMHQLNGPDRLYSYFNDYTSIKETISESVVSPKDGVLEIAHERPFTIQGFIFYCLENHKVNISKYFKGAKVDDEYKDVIDLITYFISSKQVERALLGLYNAGLVQRLNSIKEHIQIEEIDIQPVLNIDVWGED